jgi:SNF2 family DNA or RNA helicase
VKPTRIISSFVVFEAPEQVVSMFPEIKFSPPWAAVPYTLANTLLLRNLGYDAPSPIRTQYDWPIRRGRTPRWYQVDTAEFLTLNKRAFCLNAMRTGKTNSALWAADYLRKERVVRKTLIVAPLSTLERVWGDNLFIDYPGRRFNVLYGAASKRRDLLNAEADFYIVNPDGLEILQEQLKAREDIDLMIFDEVAVFRNAQTTRWRVAKSIIKPHQWLWGMTGTPTSNAPTDAFGQMKLIRPENYNGQFTRFKQHTMMQIGPFKWVPRAGAENTVNQILQPSIRFPREVNTDMEINIIERTAELSAEQERHYKKLVKEAVTVVSGTQITAVNAAVLLSKLVQTSCGVVYGSNGEIAEMDFGPRLRVLEELIEENDEKVLVFVPFTGVLDALARELRKRWTVEIVDGGVSAGKRNKIFQDFQNTKSPHIIVAHPGTMCHGLDLTAASLIIWYAPHVKNEEVGQANARIDGAAQTAKIDIAYISATSVERQIYKTLQEKGRMQQVVLDLVKNKS